MFDILDTYYIKITNYINFKIIDINTEHKFTEVKIRFSFNDEYENRLDYVILTFAYVECVDMLIYNKKLMDDTLDSRFVISIKGNTSIKGNNDDSIELIPCIIDDIKNTLNSMNKNK